MHQLSSLVKAKSHTKVYRVVHVTKTNKGFQNKNKWQCCVDKYQGMMTEEIALSNVESKRRVHQGKACFFPLNS